MGEFLNGKQNGSRYKCTSSQYSYTVIGGTIALHVQVLRVIVRTIDCNSSNGIDW